MKFTMTGVAVLLALSFSQNYLSVNAAPFATNLSSLQHKHSTSNHNNLDNKITAQELLDHWAKALGGREKLAKINTIYTKGTANASGFKGTFEDFQTMQAQHRVSTNLTEFNKGITVFNGKQGWTVDQNNILRALAGNELKDEIQHNYLATFSHLLPDRLAGKAEYQGQDRLKKYYILKITPQDGQETLYYLDKKTYLPVKEIAKDDDETAITYYSDWREVEGVKFSFKQREVDSNGEENNLTNIDQIDINHEFVQDTFNKPAQITKYKFTNGQNALSIPFELTNDNHIFLKVSINGSEPLTFVFDSGAQGSIIDKSLASKLLIKSQGKFQGGGIGEKTAAMSFISNISLSLPGVALTNLTLFSADLTPLGFDGALGYDFISQFVVELDYANKVLNLYDAQNYHYAGNGQVLPITLGDSIPNINGKITTLEGNTLDIRCQIDTGSGAVLDLTSPFVKKHQLLKSSQKMTASEGTAFGGRTKGLEGHIKNVQIGNFTFDNPVIGFSQDNKGDYASVDYDANLGGEIFRRFKLIFDYQHEQMIFEPNKHLNDPFEHDTNGLSGLSLRPTGKDHKTIVVDSVQKDSLALESDIRKGDVIIALDGELLEKFTLMQLADMFKPEGREHSLTLRRGKRVIKTKIGKSVVVR